VASGDWSSSEPEFGLATGGRKTSSILAERKEGDEDEEAGGWGVWSGVLHGFRGSKTAGRGYAGNQIVRNDTSAFK